MKVKIKKSWTNRRYDVNFPVKVEDFDKECIEEIPGIQTTEVYNKYTIRVSIGECFNIKKVLKDIRHICHINRTSNIIPPDKVENYLLNRDN